MDDVWNNLDVAARANLDAAAYRRYERYRDELRADGHMWEDDAEPILRGHIWDESEEPFA